MSKVDKYSSAMLAKYGRDWKSPLSTATHTQQTAAEVGRHTQPPSIKHEQPKKAISPLDNKIEIYHKTIKPGLTARQFQVYCAVEKIQPCTMDQVADFLKIKGVHKISGRFGELVTLGLLEVKDRTDDHKSRYITQKQVRNEG